MTFDEAKRFRVPDWVRDDSIRGFDLDAAATTDGGLRALDRLLAWMETRDFEGKPFFEALRVYLSDPTIRAELERL